MTSPATAGASADEISLRKTIRDFGAFADNHLFKQLEALFAPEVRLDYSALGAPAAPIRREDLMRNWAGLLPGFDLTLHDINIERIEITPDAALCSARVCAEHFVDGLYWQVSGHYRFEMHRTSSRWNTARWEISALTLSVEGELGSREVFAAATARVQAGLASAA